MAGLYLGVWWLARAHAFYEVGRVLACSIGSVQLLALQWLFGGTWALRTKIEIPIEAGGRLGIRLVSDPLRKQVGVIPNPTQCTLPRALLCTIFSTSRKYGDERCCMPACTIRL